MKRIRGELYNLITGRSKYRRIVMSLAVVVVFVTTYLLVLPAITLEKDKAAEQGGIDVPAIEAASEAAGAAGSSTGDGAGAAGISTGDGAVSADTAGSQNGSGSENTSAEDGSEYSDPLMYEGGDYHIAVTDINEILPQDTEIKVEEIKETDEEAYWQYFDDALKAVQSENDGRNVAGLEFAKFYDISLEADGREVEPGDAVSVKIEFEKKLSSVLGVKDEKKLRIIHFAEDEKTGEVNAEVLDAKDAKVEIVTDSKDRLTETSFEADSFSVYAVVYTVDFEHAGIGFSIPGDSYIWLSELLAALNMDIDIAEIGTVTFTDDSLINVEKVENELTEDEIKAHAKNAAADISRFDTAVKSNEDLPYDWRLTSLKAFSTSEELLITLKDGTAVAISVTDDQEEGSSDSVYKDNLADLLTNLELYIDGEKVNDEDTVDVREGMLYDLILSFKEDAAKQFDNENQLYFDLPKGFVLPDGWTDKLTINLGLDGKVYNNLLSYSVNEDGSYRLLLDWNKLDRKYQRMIAAGNLKFNLHIQGYVQPGEVRYPGYFTVTADKYDPHNASVTKTGTLDATDIEHQKISYTVIVMSDGSNEEITMTDVLGSALSYVMKDGVPDVTWERTSTMSSQVAERTTSEAQVGTAASATDPSIKNSAEGFVITIPDMHDGDVYTFKYTADVDYTKIAVSGNATAEEMANTVQIYGDSDPVDNKSVFHQKEVMYSDLVKSVEGPGKRYTEGDKTYQDLTWTIDTNSYKMISFRGSDITDEAHVYTDSLENPQLLDRAINYTGDGITIEVYGWDESGENRVLMDTRQVPWSDLETSSDLDATQGWTYHVPEDDGIYEYVITYQTKTDVTDLTSDILNKNKAVSKGGQDVVSVLMHPPGNGLGVSKRVVNQTEDDVEWEITVTINDIAEGYNHELVVEDLIPGTYLKKEDGSGVQLYKDTYIDSSIEVYGLQEGESYSTHVSQSSRWINAETDGRPDWRYSGNDYDSFKRSESNRNVLYIHFFQDEGKTNQGLQAPEDGGDSRTITIRLKTAINQDWVKTAWERYGYEAIWNGLRHQNDVYANTAHEKADVIVSGKYLVKSFKEYKDPSTWTKAHVWRFETYISGKQAGSTITIDDYFDGELWKMWPESTVQFRAGITPHYANNVGTNGEDFWISGEYGSSVEFVEDGHVRFTINELPLKSDGTAWPFYGVNYYLTPKDEAAWAKIQQMALENGGIATFTNTAESEGMTDYDTYDVELETAFKPVVKSEPTDPDTNNKVEYTIVLNQQKARLNDGQPITMEDEFENLSVDYSTIQITTDPAGREDQVTYDYSGNTGTYVIPDETKVTITYQARVLKPENVAYDENDNADVQVTNVASMLQWSDGGSKTLKVSKEAGASIYRIRLFKYGSGHMESGLNGAVFGLYQNKKDANGAPIPETDDDGNVITDAWDNTVYQKEPVKYTKGDHSGYPIVFSTGDVWMLDGLIQSELAGKTAAEIQEMSNKALLDALTGGYTTDDDADYAKANLRLIKGYADVQLNQSRDGVYLDGNTTYYLKELTPPEGYAQDASVEYYSFRFGDEPKYVDGVWQYFNNDILKVRNSPEDGSFKLKKELSGNYELSADQKASLRFTVFKQTVSQVDKTDENGNVVTDGDGNNVKVEQTTWEPVDVNVPELNEDGTIKTDEEGNTVYTKTTSLTYDQIKGGIDVTGVGAGIFRVVESLADGGTAVPPSVAHDVSFTMDEIDEDLTEVTEDGQTVKYVQFEITQDDINRGLEHSFVITNKYTQQTVTLNAKKKWLNAEDNAISPEGAFAELGVFMIKTDTEGNAVTGADGNPVIVDKNGNNAFGADGKLLSSALPVQSVRLDGTPDVSGTKTSGESASWTAQFAGLPKLDDNGNEIKYVVVETAGPDGFDVAYTYNVASTSGSEGAGDSGSGESSSAGADGSSGIGASAGTSDTADGYEVMNSNLFTRLGLSSNATVTNKQETVEFTAKKTWEFLPYRTDADKAKILADAAKEKVTLGIYYGTTEAEAYAKFTSGQKAYLSVELDGAADADQTARARESAEWEATFTSLPKADGSGTPYVWILTETKGYEGFTAVDPSDTGESDGIRDYIVLTETTSDPDSSSDSTGSSDSDSTGSSDSDSTGSSDSDSTGSSDSGYSGSTETGASAAANTIKNTEDSAEISFGKIWRNNGADGEWAKDASGSEIPIVIALYSTENGSDPIGYYRLTRDTIVQTADAEETDLENGSDARLPYTASVVSTAASAAGTDALAVWKISEMPAAVGGKETIYYVKEITQLDGYNDPAYGRLQSNGEVTVKVTGDTDRAYDGEYIINTAGVELPHTGGMGTALFYILGSLLFAGGLIILAARRLAAGRA